MTDYSGDYFETKEKINQGTEWRDTKEVPLGDSTFELGYRLLSEQELSEVRKEISFEEIAQRRSESNVDEEKAERLRELQEKDELSDEEEEEFAELYAELSEELEDDKDSLGDEAQDVIMWAGKRAIMPTEDDKRDFIRHCPPAQQAEILEHVGVEEIPDAMSVNDDIVEEALKQDMIETVTDQPYPIKTQMGMEAIMETMRALGNGIDPEDTNE